MATYLFTWNPQKWDWIDQKNLINQLPHQKPTQKWATVNTKNIGIGDQFILIKIGPIPKKEMGIIGIGQIISAPFQDQDFLRNDKVRTYVNLELEKQYCTQKWTPRGSGIVVKDNTIANEVFSKILNNNQSYQSEFSFKKTVFFPFVAKEIDIKLSQQDIVHRDEIVKALLNKYHLDLEKISISSNKSILFITQNMVDWFSAELTKKSELVALWQDKYFRNKIKVNGRKITHFSLNISNHLQDEQITEHLIFKEGTIKQIMVNAYERNLIARKECLKYWGYSCQCCHFNFEKHYGEIGKNFIHVHHIKPLSEIKAEYVLNPITDLIPVCANCHAMIHRKNPSYTIEIIRLFLEKNRESK